MNYICSVLKRMNISKIIEPQLQKTKRIIIEEAKDHSIVLFHWKAGQRVPMHAHSGTCIFKVLSGEINETRIANNKIHFNTLLPGFEGSIGDGQCHTMIPVKNSISMHYYSPVPKKLCPSMEHIKLEISTTITKRMLPKN